MKQNESVKILSNGKYVKKTQFSIIMVLIFFSSQIIFSPQVTAPSPISLENTNYYIIITNYTFYDEMKVFVEWKEQMGLTVKIVNDTEIYGLYPNLDYDEAIHEYLNDSYHNEDTQQEYVLLVGDGDKIPVHWTTWEEPRPKMDENYYSYAGYGNITPDWKLGRWSVNSISELRIVRNKTINFQKDPPRGSWKNNITLIASNEPSADDIKDDIRADYINLSSEELNIVTVYAEDGNTTNDINKSVNNGSIIVNYFGEGHSDAWGFNNFDEFNTTHASDLHNNKKLSFVFSICCDTNKIYDFAGDCLGEAWLKNTNGGAIAFIGNAETGGDSIANELFDKEMFKLIYQNGTREIGDVFTQAKINFLEKGKYNMTLSGYLLLGDPHTNIYHPELVNEDFSEEPEDWVEIGEIADYDDINEDVNITADRGQVMDRYSKNHTNLTINDSFYWECKITPRSCSIPQYPTGYASFLVGLFNKDESTNLKNSVSIFANLYAGCWENIYHFVLVISYSDGTADVELIEFSPLIGTKYLIKMWYLSDTNRTISVKIYSGATFDIYEGGTTLCLSSFKTFTVNDFGVGNYHADDQPENIFKLDYDDAYLLEM